MSETSQIRKRIKRMVIATFPSLTFRDDWPVQYLPPWRREGDRPAWSIGALTENGIAINIFSQDSMTDCVTFGIKPMTHDSDGDIQVFADYEGSANDD